MFADDETTVAEATTTEQVKTQAPESQAEAEVVEETASAQAKEIKSKNKTEGFKMLPYFENAKVVCACGNTFTTGSTKEEIRVEICSNCHPFFTGQEKFVDTEGRVERFKRLEDSKQAAKPKKEAEKKDDRPKTLKEMLMSLDNK